MELCHGQCQVVSLTSNAKESQKGVCREMELGWVLEHRGLLSALRKHGQNGRQQSRAGEGESYNTGWLANRRPFRGSFCPFTCAALPFSCQMTSGRMTTTVFPVRQDTSRTLPLATPTANPTPGECLCRCLSTLKEAQPPPSLIPCAQLATSTPYPLS